jgi:adenine deaminase
MVEVHTGALIAADIAVKGDRIAAVGDVAHTDGPQTQVHDASGAVLTPGFIDCHIHAGESQLGMTELARLLLSRGTVAIGTCFYEAGIIGGRPAIEFSLEEARRTPLKVFLSPFISCYRGLGKWGNPGRFTGEDLLHLLDLPECIEVREWNWNTEQGADQHIRAFIDAAREKGKIIAGHLAGLHGPDLQASVALGVSSDHETLEAEEAIEKARLGVRIQIRQGSYGWDLHTVAPAITQGGVDARAFMFSSDGVEASELATQGHVEHMVRLAVAEGIPPVTAVQMATLNAAEYFRVTDDLGSLAPGRYAHINVVSDLTSFEVRDVVSGGDLVVREGDWVAERPKPPSYPDSFRDSIHIAAPLEPGDFAIPAPNSSNSVGVRVIEAREGSVLTGEVHEKVAPRNGEVVADGERDLAKICVVDRHEASGRIGKGFVKGFGIKRGAIATTMSPALMNLMVIGVDDSDMAVCANRARELGGGIVAALDGHVIAEVPLPILGIASDAPFEDLVAQAHEFETARRAALGSSFRGFLTISGFTMMVVTLTGLRISDRGLVRVAEDQEELDLFVGHDG